VVVDPAVACIVGLAGTEVAAPPLKLAPPPKIIVAIIYSSFDSIFMGVWILNL
jgi:hypothetical protein